jgi:hypothetical protein
MSETTQKIRYPKYYRVARARRKIVFVERDRTGLPNLPIVQLDPFLDRHVLHCRVRSGPCPQRQRFEGHSVSLASLKEGSLRGCPLCILGYFAVTMFYTEEIVPKMSLESGYYTKYEGRLGLDLGSSFECYTTSGELNEHLRSCKMVAHKPPPDTSACEWNFYGRRIPATTVRRPFPGNTASAQTAQNARRWLQNCTLQHTKCGNPYSRRLPTRLIDVVNNRLCDTQVWDTAETPVPYACLSHCWGSDSRASNVLQTMTATLDSYKEAIPSKDLPRTFRDAIQFTRALGIPYLWIDSLCIIQDDKLDWEKEAAAMADIYMSCHVSLAASLSSNSEGGLFTRQDNSICRVGLVRCPNGESLPVYMRRRPSHIPEDDKYPLPKRGWVLQETLLSPRTIYFIGPEVVFECQESTHCECGVVEAWKQCKSLSLDLDNLSSRDWHAIIGRYTETSLTFGRDTLPALSGLAKQWLSTHPNDTYLAGLWRSTLLTDLLWFTALSSSSRAQPWRAPSWSWASIDPLCSYFTSPSKTMINAVEIVDALCLPSGADPTGTVASGHLILRGKAFDASLEYEEEDDVDEWPEDRDNPCQGFIKVDQVRIRCSLDIATWKFGLDYVAEGSTVKLLFMCSPSANTLFNETGAAWFLLVLKPLSADTFERIGTIKWRLHFHFPEHVAISATLFHRFEDTTVADYFIV